MLFNIILKNIAHVLRQSKRQDYLKGIDKIIVLFQKIYLREEQNLLSQ